VVAQASNPVIHFDRSQQRFFNDRARVQVVNWHRQKGKDFTAAAKAVDGAIQTGDAWFIVSLTQRQADETFAKCVKVAAAYKTLLRIRGEITHSEKQFDEYDRWLNRSFTWNAHEIRFPNGGRVVSLPGRDPDTIAGLSGNVILTEYGLFPNGGYDHWSVIFPIITRSGRYQLILISTPRGKNTKFFECFNSPDQYSIHFCDIEQSVFEEGYQLFDKHGQPYKQATRAEQEAALTEFRKLYNDESKWPREYKCEFTGDLEALVKFAQLQAAGDAGRMMPFDWLRIDGDNALAIGWTPNWFARQDIKPGRIEIGWDVARQGDLSSVWCNHAVPGKAKSLRFLMLMQKTSFALQREIVKAAMHAPGGSLSVGAGDATGLGMDSNETMKTTFGDERWLPFTFTSKGKAELGSIGATTYDGAAQTIPPLDGPAAFIGADIAAIQADRSGNNLRLDEGDNPLLPESHCDVAYSNFLALRAGQLVGPAPRASMLGGGARERWQ